MAASAAAEQEKAEREKQQARTKRPFNFWADPLLADALDRYMESMPVETKYTAHLEMALREYLEKRGFWPPPPTDQGEAEE